MINAYKIMILMCVGIMLHVIVSVKTIYLYLITLMLFNDEHALNDSMVVYVVKNLKLL